MKVEPFILDCYDKIRGKVVKYNILPDRLDSRMSEDDDLHVFCYVSDEIFDRGDSREILDEVVRVTLLELSAVEGE